VPRSNSCSRSTPRYVNLRKVLLLHVAGRCAPVSQDSPCVAKSLEGDAARRVQAERCATHLGASAAAALSSAMLGDACRSRSAPKGLEVQAGSSFGRRGVQGLIT
jgi:hypothetical protein